MQVSVENCCLLYRWKPQKENGGENMKKYISVVLALVVFFVCAVSAYAISFGYGLGTQKQYFGNIIYNCYLPKLFY